MTSNFHVPDIECEQCLAAIQGTLSGLDGVYTVKVDINACTVVVHHDEAQMAATAIRTLLEELGFPPAP